MKSKRGLRVGIMFLFASALSFCLNGCRTSQPTTQTTPTAGMSHTTFPRTLRDGNGTEVTIKARPARIVSQTLGTDEILWEICPRERLIGVSKIALEPKYSVIAEELKTAKIAAVTNAEEILQLQPDLVFVASFSRAEVVENLQIAGATIFRFANFDTIESLQENIRLLGQVIGEEAKAEKLVARMNEELATIKARIPAGKPPRVLSFSLSGNTAGAGTLFDSIVQATGAVNVAAEKGLSGFPKISPEQVVEWQPDFLLAGAEETKADEAKARLLAHPVIATTNAAQAGRIIVMDARYLLSVSQYITRAVGQLADALYQSSAKSQAKAAAK